MNGAEALLKTLVDGGVELCFANPGTSELPLVSAIGNTEAMRAVLCLFEGVATGAADGYARFADKPAITLLHVGCGYSNGMANLHNARRARVPLVNLVGDHASYHLEYDAPLTSDVAAHARIVSTWVGVSQSADDLSSCGARAVQASLQGSGRIATLIAPADHGWETASTVAPALPVAGPPAVDRSAIDRACVQLADGRRTAMLLGGRALRHAGLAAAGRIAEATGARLLCETFPARMQRGEGRVAVERLPYFAERASKLLAAFDQLILVGANAPVAFFAHPGQPSWLAPEACEVWTLADTDCDLVSTLQALAAGIAAADQPTRLRARGKASIPGGKLTAMAVGTSLRALLPEHAIVSDEGATSGLAIYAMTETAARHDWLTLTGGAIGQGLPLSLGAALARPDRKVVALQADGSAMYTVQALWSLAREQADVTVVLLNNGSYAILNMELARLGPGAPTARTLSMLDLSSPDIRWVDIATGMGVPATRASSAEAFHQQFADAMATKGPTLIEAIIEPMPL